MEIQRGPFRINSTKIFFRAALTQDIHTYIIFSVRKLLAKLYAYNT